MTDHSNLIGFFGYKGAGKDRAARLITETMILPVHVEKFAEPLKAMAAAFLEECTDLPPELVHGDRGCLTRDGEMQALVDLTGGRIKSVRQLLQWLGTECGRAMSSDVWVNAMRAKLTHDRLTGGLPIIAITDARFRNEFELIKELGGCCVLVKRPGLAPDGHASEDIPAKDWEFDWIINNDGDEAKLALLVERMMMVRRRTKLAQDVDVRALYSDYPVGECPWIEV